MNVNQATEMLRDYCKPWEEGGAGNTDLTESIECVLAEIERLQRALAQVVATKSSHSDYSASAHAAAVTIAREAAEAARKGEASG